LDEEIFNDRVAGLSAREIATKYHLTVPEVNEALDRRAGLITEHERARALSVEIARMDKIYSYFDKRAEGGDAAAGNICIKASERKSALLGLDAPVWTRIDAVARVEKVQPSRVPSTKFAPRLTDSGPNTGNLRLSGMVVRPQISRIRLVRGAFFRPRSPDRQTRS
jgi:hypothetical protein